MAKLTGEERKRILAKIKKLLALKEGAEKIGSEGEAYAAASGVHRLLTEYNLSMADVMGEDGERKGPKIEESDGISYASHFGLWKQKLMGIICRYNYCQSIISPQTKQVVIVGQEDNIAVCHQLYDYLVKAFVRLAKEKFLNYYAIHDMPLSVARIQIGEKEVQGFFHSYYIGVDLAGLKGYELSFISYYQQNNHVFLRELKECGLSGVLFQLMGSLSDALDENCTGQGIIALLSVFSDCFGMFTGCEKDLWWFVEKKMRFNKQRPMLNGKKY